MIVGTRRIEGEMRDVCSVFQRREGDQEILEDMVILGQGENGSSGGSGGGGSEHLSRRQTD